MNRLAVFVSVLAVVALAVTTSSAAPVFEDPFTVDPAANGWTEDPDGGSITHNGTDAVFAGAGGSTQAITRTISTSGRTDLYVDFTYRGGPGTEDNDFFTFLVDSNNDGTFEAVTSSGATSTDQSNLDPTPLPASAANKANLPIRMTWDHNFDNEDGLLEHLVIFDAPLVLATDPFDLDPAANGWTESGGSITSNGSGQASLQGTPASSITKTFDFTGLTNILINLEGLNDGFNGDDDRIIMEVDTGSGFVEVGEQVGTASPYLLGAYVPDAANNPSVSLRLTADSSFNGQDTLFDQLTIRGALIPEPASLALLGLGGLMILGRRR